MGAAHIVGHIAVERMHPGSRFRTRLERCIPLRVVDVDWPHLHAMLAHIAHNLGRRIESHGLRVEQSSCKHIRITALEPGRGINQEREARSMAFRKAIFAEPLDLTEAALGEFARIIPLDHSLDHLGLESADGPRALERRHGPAQLVGLSRSETTGHNGDLHRLFLEQRHAESLAEHGFELFGRIGNGLEPLPASKIGVHHVPLNGTGPHDRHLDDQVIEFLRLETRQHRHLRAALYLKHAD